MKIKNMIVILPLAVLIMGCAEAEELTPIDKTDLLTAGPVVVETEDVETSDTLMVFVCGEVNNPGVYEMASGDRVCDAIIKAGDFTPEADAEYLNLAAGLTDGQRLYVPSESESEQGMPTSSDGDGDTGLVNINTATASELKTLPGIGDVKAGAIIAYREAHGEYTSIEQIKQVDGIKSGLYDSIKDMITVY